jgi:hypothetical protein
LVLFSGYRSFNIMGSKGLFLLFTPRAKICHLEVSAGPLKFELFAKGKTNLLPLDQYFNHPRYRASI